MFQTIYFIVLMLTIMFGFVVFFGAPYLPTRRRQIYTALNLLDLKTGDTLLELGSGDGRVALAAAKRGWRVVGYELNPLLVLLSKAVTWRYRDKVKIIWGSYWNVKWPKAQGIFVFLIGKKMRKLNKKIVQECEKPINLVSFAFEIPDRKADAFHDGVFLYRYTSTSS